MMNNIDALISRLSPFGVDYFTLGLVCEIKTGKGITHKEIVGGGEYPVMSGGTTLMGYFDRYNRDAGTVTIARAGSAGAVNYLNTKFWVNDKCFTVIPNAKFKDKLSSKYLFYALKNIEESIVGMRSAGSVPTVNTEKISRISIPLPPMDIQIEIVAILDKFTLLEAELEAELEARRSQHEYYWNHLLAPDETWKKTTLGAIAEVYDGPHATPAKTKEGPWYLSISSLKNGRVDLTKSAHLSEEQYPKWIKRVSPMVGDTLFSYETRVGQAAYWETDEPAALGRRMGLLRPRTDVVDPRFLTLLYLGPEFQKTIEVRTVRGSTVDRIPIANMAKWEVSIPPLDEQLKIVERVDAFDALVNDLKIGLPAEISARRQQYEYYRNKLLTFEELKV